MQRAQSQSSLSRKATDDKAAKAGANAAGNSGSATPNGKNQDVWPDDVEVAFWEGMYKSLSAPHSMPCEMFESMLLRAPRWWHCWMG